MNSRLTWMSCEVSVLWSAMAITTLLLYTGLYSNLNCTHEEPNISQPQRYLMLHMGIYRTHPWWKFDSLLGHLVIIKIENHIRQHTVFCRINVPAWINAPPTFEFDWLYLKNSYTNSNQISSTYCEGTQEVTQSILSKSDRVKGSFCASTPSTFIRRNTVFTKPP